MTTELLTSGWTAAQWQCLQSEWVRVAKRISADVDVGIHASMEPHGIGLAVASRLRIVVPKVAVVRIGFAIEVLPRKPEVAQRQHRYGLVEAAPVCHTPVRALRCDRVAERVGEVVPNDVSRTVGQLLWRA